MKRVVFCVLAGLTLTAAVLAASPASASPQAAAVHVRKGPPWLLRYHPSVSGSAFFTSIEATGPASAWAVGQISGKFGPRGGFAAHWNGRAWRQATPPISGLIPVSVSASSARDVWIFAFVKPPAGQPVTAARALHWNGTRWQVMTLPQEPLSTWGSAGTLESAVFGPRDVWVTGGTVGHNQSLVWHWTGVNWAKTTVPAFLTQISGTADGDLRALGTRSSPAANVVRWVTYRWTGAEWRAQPGPRLMAESIAVDAPRDIWIAGRTARQSVLRTTIEHWNGRRWSSSTIGFPGAPEAFADGRGGFWAGPARHHIDGAWFSAAGPIWGKNCTQAGFIGTIAGIPGTAASWAAGGCTLPRSSRVLPRISINGRL
jgi:hypothetical protein